MVIPICENCKQRTFSTVELLFRVFFLLFSFVENERWAKEDKRWVILGIVGHNSISNRLEFSRTTRPTIPQSVVIQIVVDVGGAENESRRRSNGGYERIFGRRWSQFGRQSTGYDRTWRPARSRSDCSQRQSKIDSLASSAHGAGELKFDHFRSQSDRKLVGIRSDSTFG